MMKMTQLPVIGSIGAVGRCFCDPRRRPHRYIIFILICILKVGDPYCYVIPSAIADDFIRIMRINTAQYEMLNSVYSWPNVVLVLIGGFLFDRVLGLRLGLLVFLAILSIGQFLTTIGAFTNQYWLMVLGRFVFGVGGETSAAAAEILTTVVLSENELSFVFGVQFSVGLLASSASLGVSRKLFDYLTDHIQNPFHRLGTVLLVGELLTIFCFIVALVAAALDYRRERILQCAVKESKPICFNYIKAFSLRLWILCFATSIFFMGTFPFLSVASVYFKQKYNMNESSISIINALALFIPAVLYPFVGLIVDWTGYKITWGLLCTLAALINKFLFAFSSPTANFLPYIGIAINGVTYAIINIAIWPLVFPMVEKNKIAIAYGLLYSALHLGQSIATIIVGVIVDKAGYLYLLVFFAIIFCWALFLINMLYIVDNIFGKNILNISGWARRQRIKVAQEKQSDDSGALKELSEITNSDV